MVAVVGEAGRRVVYNSRASRSAGTKDIMEALLVWIRRVIRIGVLTFLSKLGFKALFGLLVVFAGLVALVVLLLVLLLGLVF